MNIEQANRTAPPWLMRTALELSTLKDFVSNICTRLKIMTVDGQAMMTVEGVMDEFGRSFDFPDYYGKNSAALEECLMDLSWLPANGYVILVQNSQLVLTLEPPQELLWLMRLLEDVCKEWGHPIADGQPWDRAALPCHVVFQYDENDAANINTAIRALPELHCP